METDPERCGAPRGDASRHRPLIELAAGLRTLAQLPPDEGRVVLLVSRRADGGRETPERARITPEEGMPGDAWSRRPSPNPDGQLAVMRSEVAALIANGRPWTLFGDNLFVDFDLSAANLPAGAQLRVGEALVAVTPKPHDGCRKFTARFGNDALRFVSAKTTRDQNLRGIYWKVIEAGEVRVGDAIRVVSRP